MEVKGCSLSQPLPLATSHSLFPGVDEPAASRRSGRATKGGAATAEAACSYAAHRLRDAITNNPGQSRELGGQTTSPTSRQCLFFVSPFPVTVRGESRVGTKAAPQRLLTVLRKELPFSFQAVWTRRMLPGGHSPKHVSPACTYTRIVNCGDGCVEKRSLRCAPDRRVNIRLLFPRETNTAVRSWRDADGSWCGATYGRQKRRGIVATRPGLASVKTLCGAGVQG
ncbi:hypothetical protein MRX96_043542 [Rhipicephalus microplus]